MATYGLIALLAAPARHRTPALASALIVALFVGSTRIVLGVHWMTDVIGGWSAGLVALVLVASLSRARTAA
jgi:undecaprenyl-diphosphatase